MKPVAKLQVKPQKLYEPENIFFLVAMFAIALAGDLIWWQTKQMTDDIEYSNANFYSVVRSEARDAERINADINSVESDAAQELDALDLIEE